jgi:thymidylate synthase
MELGEAGYLNLLKLCLETGDKRTTRNGATRSLFGAHLSFDLKTGFPLITTKKMFTKGIIAELIWFLNGRTDNRVLKLQGVHIWDGNSTREYLDRRGLVNYNEDECGPIYGFQWRRFNCTYPGRNVPISQIPMHKPEQDQFAKIISLIQNDPMSRRMVMSGWNPCQIDEMCLEPCHVLYQFYVRIVDGRKFLSCHLYQRSADLFLGVPFNIASCALLTHIIANITECHVDKLMISFGDVHVYESHVEVVKTQITRTPYPFPQLEIGHDGPKIELENLEKLEPEIFKIVNYTCHPALKALMAV